MPAAELGAGNVNIASRRKDAGRVGTKRGIPLSARFSSSDGSRTANLSRPVMVEWVSRSSRSPAQHASSTPPPSAAQKHTVVPRDQRGRRRRVCAHDGRLGRPAAPGVGGLPRGVLTGMVITGILSSLSRSWRSRRWHGCGACFLVHLTIKTLIYLIVILFGW